MRMFPEKRNNLKVKKFIWGKLMEMSNKYHEYDGNIQQSADENHVTMISVDMLFMPIEAVLSSVI